MYTWPASTSSRIWRKKNVSSSVRMWLPSTSASHRHDDLVVADLGDVELLADAGADGRDQRLDLVVLQHLVEAGPLDVEDLAADRQDRLRARVAGIDGGAAGRVALDDEQLATRRRSAAEQSFSLSGMPAPVERGLAADGVAGVLGRDPGLRGGDAPS